MYYVLKKCLSDLELIKFTGVYFTVHQDLTELMHYGAVAWGNSVIPVNGDESVDLENTQLYKKASTSSLTYVKTIL